MFLRESCDLQTAFFPLRQDIQTHPRLCAATTDIPCRMHLADCCISTAIRSSQSARDSFEILPACPAAPRECAHPARSAPRWSSAHPSPYQFQPLFLQDVLPFL